MSQNIVGEIMAIATEQGYSGGSVSTVAEAIDALTSALGGTVTAPNKGVAQAISTLGPSIGGGGGGGGLDLSGKPVFICYLDTADFETLAALDEVSISAVFETYRAAYVNAIYVDTSFDNGIQVTVSAAPEGLDVTAVIIDEADVISQQTGKVHTLVLTPTAEAAQDITFAVSAGDDIDALADDGAITLTLEAPHYELPSGVTANLHIAVGLAMTSSDDPLQ